MALLSIDRAAFDLNFDRRPFYIAHALGGHPLLELPAMAALSERLPRHVVEWNNDGSGAYGDIRPAKAPTLPCPETILRVGELPAWVLLREIEHDPVYRGLLDELLDEIEPLSESRRPGMCQREGFLFVSSRAAVTPFHFDPEHNFLLQIRGRKTVHMWDPMDRAVLPAAALDAHYAGVDGSTGNRKQLYREEFLERAWVLPLEAGQGLHFPLHAPHQVRTESDVSVSLSITFRSRESRVRETIHAANGHLRRLGVRPPEPGVSRLWDSAVRTGYRAASRARSLAGRVSRRLRLR